MLIAFSTIMDAVVLGSIWVCVCLHLCYLWEMRVSENDVFSHRRPGILVLINDADWELMVSTGSHVHCQMVWTGVCVCF